MASAHDLRVVRDEDGGESDLPLGESIEEGISFVNLTAETLGIGCIPYLSKGDSVGSLFAQFGASEAKNITQAVEKGEGTFTWVQSRSEHTIAESESKERRWVLLICRRTPENVLEVLGVHHTEYLVAWQLAVLPGMLAVERPPVARVKLRGHQINHAATMMPALVKAMVQKHANTM